MRTFFCLLFCLFVFHCAGAGSKNSCPGNRSPSELERFCKKIESDPLCSGRGRCDCGRCFCYQRPSAKFIISGSYCECDNYNCLYYNSQLCAGHGACVCKQCHCDDGWHGDACQCPDSLETCRDSNGTICNNRGTCGCGVCRCDEPFYGPTCAECPSCPNKCQEFKSCVECKLFITEKNETLEEQCEKHCLNVARISAVQKVPKSQSEYPLTPCKSVDKQDCTLYFGYQQKDNKERNYHVWANKVKICPLPVSRGDAVRSKRFVFLVFILNIFVLFGAKL